ncbi:MAG: 3-phosphoshikimate 1-carboxyvinyltransferase, partial [Gammaproteobacteria bacterium]|nr:3-phosphoshikimate 1-carboxyvinyltransferase [Gammaproteobacteria bacterium]
SLATLNAFRAMGVKIEQQGGEVTIFGVGLHGLRAAAAPLDLGNSGTSMRLLSGLLAGQSFAATLVGDASLSKRPMGRVIQPLSQMGAIIHSAEAGRPPLQISPVAALQGIDYLLPVASAQVKSALLLAGLYASSPTSVTEPAPTRDHTERMLAGFGYPLQRQGSRVTIQPGGRLTAGKITVPADISSATFFIVGAAISKGSHVTLCQVGVNPTRTGVIQILRQMGADIAIANEHLVGGEPVADITVRYAPLHGIDIPEAEVPLAIDEFPAIFIAAAVASGVTRLTGAEELRVKESDRIAVMAEGLQRLGVVAEATPDGMIIHGGKGFSGGKVASYGDHRIAMSFAMAALCASAAIEISDCANVATSFPGFTQLATTAGLAITEVN